MDLIYTSMCALALLGAIILQFVMLIKSFKEGGALTGLLGLVTGGLYTYVWGWLKSKQLQLTKPMLLWSVCMILVGALVYVTGPAKMMQSIPYDVGLDLLTQSSKKVTTAKNAEKSAVRKVRKKVTANKQSQNDTLKNADWNTRAVSLWQRAQYTDSQKAVSFLQRAIQEDPAFAEAYNNRGNAYRGMREYAKAMHDYNKAISLAPNLEQTYNNRGNIYYDQRNFQMAVRDYNKALSLNANYPLAYLNRGLAYHQLNKDDLACRDFVKACELGECDGVQWGKKTKTCQ
jgi:tetratricopeptide (TPR) repeat protein